MIMTRFTSHYHYCSNNTIFFNQMLEYAKGNGTLLGSSSEGKQDIFPLFKFRLSHPHFREIDQNASREGFEREKR